MGFSFDAENKAWVADKASVKEAVGREGKAAV
jgi:hypothetical protein